MAKSAPSRARVKYVFWPVLNLTNWPLVTMIGVGFRTVTGREVVVFMKTDAAYARVALLTGPFVMPLYISLAADSGLNAADATVAQRAASAAIEVSTAPVPAKLPYGVDDVLKLSRAQIGDEIILNYVRNSETIYNLGANDIVYLKNAGVSEKVISAMLDKRKHVEMAAQTQSAQTPVAANVPTGATPNAVPAAPAYADSYATYAQAPLTPPTSSAYAVPYPATTYPYYGPYGYYGPYYGGYYGPGVTFAFGFGGGRYYYGGRYCYGGRGYYGGRGSYYGGRGGHR
jgi:hypothetical protein